MRKIFYAIVLALLVLTSIVVGRTLLVPAYQPSLTTAPLSNFDALRVSKHLSEALRFRTVSWQDGADAADIAASHAAFVSFRDWITATYPHFSATVEREIISDYSLLFKWAGSDPSLKPILLMAHLDVVPIAPGTEKSWIHGPFAGDIADGYVWGRGTMDAKSGIVGMLDAIEYLVASNFKPKRTIMFAFGHDEENGGSTGNKKIAELLASRNIKLEFVDDEGGGIVKDFPGVSAPVANIGIAEKGSVTLEITAHSEGGHSSMPPPVNETAIGRLARAIRSVESNPFDGSIDGLARAKFLQLMPAMPITKRLFMANLWLFAPVVAHELSSIPAAAAGLHTTIAPTIISGGNKTNVLPPDAKATINFRIHPRDSIASVTAHVRAAINDNKVDVELKGTGREPSPVSDIDGPQYALIKHTLEKIMPNVIVAPGLVLGGTDSRYYFQLTNNVFRMIPFLINIEDAKRIHGTDERISVQSLGIISDFYFTLITSLDQ